MQSDEFFTQLTDAKVFVTISVGLNVCSCSLIQPNFCRLLDFCHDRLEKSPQANEEAVVVDEVKCSALYHLNTYVTTKMHILLICTIVLS